MNCEGKVSPQDNISATSFREKVSWDIGTLLFNPDFSDFVIVLHGEEIPAHMGVLAARSPYFAMMLRSGMKEAFERKLYVDDVDKDLYKDILEFIYTGACRKIGEHCEELLPLADRYLLTGLKEMCGNSLICKCNIQNCVDIYILAHQHKVEPLKTSVKHFILCHFESVLGSEAWEDLKYSKPALVIEVLSRNKLISRG